MGWVDTSGTVSSTRLPVSSESAAAVRENAMLTNSVTASFWSVVRITWLPPVRRAPRPPPEGRSRPREV